VGGAVIVVGEVGGTVGGTVVEVDGDVGTGAVAAGVGATVVVGARGRRTSVPQATTVKLHTIDTIARKPAGDERIITAY
jgi:hypothetical protein